MVHCEPGAIATDISNSAVTSSRSADLIIALVRCPKLIAEQLEEQKKTGATREKCSELKRSQV